MTDEYVKMLHRIADTEPHEGVRYYHIDAPAVGACGEHGRTIEVEAHFRPLFLDSPLRNWRFLDEPSVPRAERQRWFRENEQFGVHDAVVGVKTKTGKTPEGIVSNEVSEIECEHPSSATSSSMDSDAVSSMPSGKKQGINRLDVIPVPTVSFNAVYQLAHIYRHLFDEGIGLRQLLDYYFVLRALHIEQGELADRTESMAQWAEGMGIAVKSNEEIMHTLSRFGMKKFASATMYVIAKVFANDDDTANAYDNDNFCLNDWQKRWPWMICEPNEKEGKLFAHCSLLEVLTRASSEPPQRNNASRQLREIRQPHQTRDPLNPPASGEDWYATMARHREDQT